mmetsp:Transcript_31930/g.105911  ORF Transcript_31930/g.105911 Transcript_31930/m.105911 type:complete len:344 (-) Transcript_31930:348-1379(-)
MVHQLDNAKRAAPNNGLDLQIGHRYVQILQVHTVLQVSSEHANDVSECLGLQHEARATAFRLASGRPRSLQQQAAFPEVVPAPQRPELDAVLQDLDRAAFYQEEVLCIFALFHNDLARGIPLPHQRADRLVHLFLMQVLENENVGQYRLDLVPTQNLGNRTPQGHRECGGADPVNLGGCQGEQIILRHKTLHNGFATVSHPRSQHLASVLLEVYGSTSGLGHHRVLYDRDLALGDDEKLRPPRELGHELFALLEGHLLESVEHKLLLGDRELPEKLHVALQRAVAAENERAYRAPPQQHLHSVVQPQNDLCPQGQTRHRVHGLRSKELSLGAHDADGPEDVTS